VPRLVIALGTAVVMGAPAGPSAPTVGADPAASPSASAKAEREGQGNSDEKAPRSSPARASVEATASAAVAFGRITVTAVSGSKRLARDDRRLDPDDHSHDGHEDHEGRRGRDDRRREGR
jgi:hypothetical protein